MEEKAPRRVGKHEPLEAGREYLINEGTSCEGRVMLVRCDKLFCTVRSVNSEYTWDTMVYRLTDIPEGYVPPARKHTSIIEAMTKNNKDE